MRRLLLLAPLAAIAATPAFAADPAQLNCPLAALNAQQRDAAADAVIGLTPGGGSGLELVRAAVGNCAARHAWSQQASSAAVGFHAASIAAAKLRTRLTAAGFDLAPLERAVLADRVLIASFGPGGLDDGAMRAFAARNGILISQLLEGRSAEIGSVLGKFIGFVISAEATRILFIAN